MCPLANQTLLTHSVFLFLGPVISTVAPPTDFKPYSTVNTGGLGLTCKQWRGRGRPSGESTRKQHATPAFLARAKRTVPAKPAPSASPRGNIGWKRNKVPTFTPDQRPAPVARSTQKEGPCPRLLVLPFGTNQYPIPRRAESLSQHRAELRFCPLRGLSTSVQTPPPPAPK